MATKIACLILALTLISRCNGFPQSSPGQDTFASDYPKNGPGDFVDDSAFSNGHGQGGVEPQGPQLPGNGFEYLMGAPAPHNQDGPMPNRPTNGPGDFVDDSAFSNGHGQGGVEPQGPQLPGNGFEYLMGAPAPHNQDGPVPNRPTNGPGDFVDDSAFSNGHGQGGVEPMKPHLPGNGFEYLMGAPVPYYDNLMFNKRHTNGPDNFILHSIFNNGHGLEDMKPTSLIPGSQSGFGPSHALDQVTSDHGVPYDPNSQGNFGQDGFGGHAGDMFGLELGYGPFGQGSHGQDHFEPGLHGQGNIGPGSHGQGHFGPSIHGQGNFGPGSHGQGHFGPGIHGQDHFGPGNHGQGHFGPGQDHFGQGNHGHDHFRPGSHGQTHLRPGNHGHDHFGPRDFGYSEY